MLAKLLMLYPFQAQALHNFLSTLLLHQQQQPSLNELLLSIEKILEIDSGEHHVEALNVFLLWTAYMEWEGIDIKPVWQRFFGKDTENSELFKVAYKCSCLEFFEASQKNTANLSFNKPLNFSLAQLRRWEATTSFASSKDVFSSLPSNTTLFCDMHPATLIKGNLLYSSYLNIEDNCEKNEKIAELEKKFLEWLFQQSILHCCCYTLAEQTAQYFDAIKLTLLSPNLPPILPDTIKKMLDTMHQKAAYYLTPGYYQLALLESVLALYHEKTDNKDAANRTYQMAYFHFKCGEQLVPLSEKLEYCQQLWCDEKKPAWFNDTTLQFLKSLVNLLGEKFCHQAENRAKKLADYLNSYFLQQEFDDTVNFNNDYFSYRLS